MNMAKQKKLTGFLKTAQISKNRYIFAPPGKTNTLERTGSTF